MENQEQPEHNKTQITFGEMDDYKEKEPPKKKKKEKAQSESSNIFSDDDGKSVSSIP